MSLFCTIESLLASQEAARREQRLSFDVVCPRSYLPACLVAHTDRNEWVASASSAKIQVGKGGIGGGVHGV